VEGDYETATVFPAGPKGGKVFTYVCMRNPPTSSLRYQYPYQQGGLYHSHSTGATGSGATGGGGWIGRASGTGAAGTPGANSGGPFPNAAAAASQSQLLSKGAAPQKSKLKRMFSLSFIGRRLSESQMRKGQTT
jgi:hypothetical protein